MSNNNRRSRNSERSSRPLSGPPPAVNPEASLDKALRHDIGYIGEKAANVEKVSRQSLTVVGRSLLPESMARCDFMMNEVQLIHKFRFS